MVTPAQRALVLAASHGLSGPSVSKEEFLRRWPHTDGSRLGRDLLEHALTERDGDDLEYALLVGWIFGVTPDYLPLLSAAAHADWHQRHEDVAQGLVELGTEEALPALAELVRTRPAHLDHLDGAVALARYALHGIANVGGHRAETLLVAALDDDRELVRSEARRLLGRS